jgi:phosphatidylglycerol:prolipoprotein diacylglycerol transferase
MYPNLYYMFQDLFGLEIPVLQIVNTFGFFVALSFISANMLMTWELKRKEKEGSIQPQKKTVIKGKPASLTDLLPNMLFGFIIGWKFIYLAFHFSEYSGDIQHFVFSGKGSLVWGFVLAAAFGAYDYFRLKREELDEPVEEEVWVHPWQLMGNITIVAAIAGLIGAKVFHNLEYLDDFMRDPVGSLLSFSGLTFFGGLVVGGAAVLWYAGKNGIHWRKMLDVGAPAMMFAYALGRMGCQMSGDGDWGIVNSADKPAWMGFLPDWFWAYNYPNNVLRQCNPYEGAEALLHPCNWEQTPFLIAPVFPTPLYETIVCLILFGVLWALRKRIRIPGVLFAIYMIFAGIERFFIEKIRVNSRYEIGDFSFTQAELISVLMVLSGAIAIWFFSKRNNSPEKEANASLE